MYRPVDSIYSRKYTYGKNVRKWVLLMMLGQLIFLKITAVSFVLLVWCATPHRTIIFLIIKITASHLNLGFITAISTPPADFMIWCVYMVPLGVWCL